VSTKHEASELSRVLTEALSVCAGCVQQTAATAASLTGPLAAAEKQLTELNLAGFGYLQRLVGKAADAGVAQPYDVPGPIRPDGDLKGLIELEESAMTALQAIIPEAGESADAEALEHLIEHFLLTKRELIELLRRLAA
jgi:hypothetical protein